MLEGIKISSEKEKLLIMKKILLFFILLLSLHTVNATTILVDPTRIINTSLTSGSKFTINVNVSDVTDLSSYQFKLSFNNSVLNATGIKSINSIWDCYNHKINNSVGFIQVDCVLDGALNGNVKLETINFSVIGTGESNLHLNDTLLGDSQGSPITHDTIDEFFSNNPSGACFRTNPTVTLSPELQNGTVGSTFVKTVTVTNNDNNYCNSSIFNLTYSCPSGWSCFLNKNSVSIIPQLNDSSTILTVNSSSSASLGNYTVSVTAINNSYTKTGSANITIISLGNKTAITASADPVVVERYKNSVLWCDYRNATSDTEILNANIKFEVIINSTYTVNYTGVYNTTSKVYEYPYNSTYPGWDTVRCDASAPDYEPNFATFSLVTCGISPELTLSPVYQSGNNGSTLKYSIEVYNQDIPPYCNNSTYNLSVNPSLSGWTYLFDSNLFTLDPAEFFYTNLSVTSSSSASSGNYTINVTAANINNNLYRTTDSIIYNVTGGTIPTTTTTSITTSTTTTIITTTTTIPSDNEPPKWGPTYEHIPSSPIEGEDVTIRVDWSDNTDLNTVIFYENSSGTYQTHNCSLITYQCSGEETILETTNLYLIIFIFSGSLTYIVISIMKLKRLNKTMLFFVGIILVIILISVFMFPEISQNISKLLRLSIFRMAVGPTTFTHVIPGSQLNTPGIIVEYYSFANDTAGNWNTTQNNTFTVQPTTTTTPAQVTTTPSGSGGGGRGGSIQSTGFYNFTNSIEVEIGYSKTISGNFFSRDILRNVVFNITGINESWYVINPLSIDEIKNKEIMNISITFTIPDNITLTTYPIQIIAKSGSFTYKKGLNLTIISKSVTTTSTTTTISTINTTIPLCVSSGNSCISNSNCCSNYCCKNICSDTPCTKRIDFLRNVTIAIALISGALVGVYNFYSKIIKAKILAAIVSISGALVGVYYLYKKIVKQKLTEPKVTTPTPEKVPTVSYEQIEKVLLYLKRVGEELKQRGYNIPEYEMELLSAENDLKQNLFDSAAFHLEKAKMILKKFFR